MRLPRHVQCKIQVQPYKCGGLSQVCTCVGGHVQEVIVSQQRIVSFIFFLMVTSQMLTRPITNFNFDKLCQHLDINMTQYQIFFICIPKTLKCFSFHIFLQKRNGPFFLKNFQRSTCIDLYISYKSFMKFFFSEIQLWITN